MDSVWRGKALINDGSKNILPPIYVCMSIASNDSLVPDI